MAAEHTEVLSCTVILRSLSEMQQSGAGLRWNFLEEYWSHSAPQESLTEGKHNAAASSSSDGGLKCPRSGGWTDVQWSEWKSRTTGAAQGVTAVTEGERNTTGAAREEVSSSSDGGLKRWRSGWHGEEWTGVQWSGWKSRKQDDVPRSSSHGDYWEIPDDLPYLQNRTPDRVDFDESTDRFSKDKKNMSVYMRLLTLGLELFWQFPFLLSQFFQN